MNEFSQHKNKESSVRSELIYDEHWLLLYTTAAANYYYYYFINVNIITDKKKFLATFSCVKCEFMHKISFL